MARQKPPSKAGAFWRAINVREDLAHDSAQGFVLERSTKCGVKSFAPLRGKPPYGAPNITEPLKGRKNKERIRQIQRQRKDRKAKFGYGITVSLFAWRAIRKLDSITRA